MASSARPWNSTSSRKRAPEQLRQGNAAAGRRAGEADGGGRPARLPDLGRRPRGGVGRNRAAACGRPGGPDRHLPLRECGGDDVVRVRPRHHGGSASPRGAQRAGRADPDLGLSHAGRTPGQFRTVDRDARARFRPHAAALAGGPRRHSRPIDRSGAPGLRRQS